MLNPDEDSVISTVLAKKIVSRYIIFEDINGKEITDPIFETIEYRILVDAKYEKEEQKKTKNQDFLIQYSLVNKNGDPVKQIQTTLKGIPYYQMPEIKLPEIAGYHSRLKNDKISGQYLWLGLGPNIDSESDSILDNGLTKYVIPNQPLTIVYAQSSIETNEKPEVVLKEKLMPIVKVGNEFNDLEILKKVDQLTEFENNFFYLCIAQFYEQHDKILRFKGSEVRKMSNFRSHISNKELLNKIERTFAKLTGITDRIKVIDGQTGEVYSKTTSIFKESKVYYSSLEIEIQVNPGFIRYFNELPTWTRFSLTQYTKLHTNYSKALYRGLKQYRTVGKRIYSMEQFRYDLSIPDSYTPSDIQRRVLDKGLEELSPYFMSLKITKNYGKGLRGRRLLGYTFTWKKESKNQKDSRYNKLLDDTIAIYSIRSNANMTDKQKFRAIDRYRGYILGTSEKDFLRRHPQTYFLDKDTTKRSSRSVYARDCLEDIPKYTYKQLQGIVLTYENINRHGKLLMGDIKDLVLLEKRLTQMKYRFILDHPKQEKVINDNTLSAKLMNYLLAKSNINSRKFREWMTTDKVRIELAMLVQSDYGLYKTLKYDDHRPPESRDR